ncbi:hypothetical protein Hamer_G029755 [Homarus americanus]|uniref:Uncharacterized protein n=1 Tax=Homarus americanus TaxID=6706 RepID=A0A8J5N7E6_HOMAM|nr:hypothetical protein Hamer_G029755 [Homarus americanus]
MAGNLVNDSVHSSVFNVLLHRWQDLRYHCLYGLHGSVPGPLWCGAVRGGSGRPGR